MQNFPAQGRKKPFGSEIISIDKKKTKLYEAQIYNLLNSGKATLVKIDTKYNGKKYQYDVR